MIIRVITPPAAYPITLAEAKEYCRIEADNTSEDATLTMLIAAMTEQAEHLTGRAFVERTLEANLNYFGYEIELPHAPLLGVNSIKYTDVDGQEQTISASAYEVDTVSAPGKIRPTQLNSWPSLGFGYNPIRINFQAGYRPAGSPVDLTDNDYLPQVLRTWLSAKIVTLYDNRATIITNGTINEMPRDYIDGLLDSLKLGTRFF